MHSHPSVFVQRRGCLGRALVFVGMIALATPGRSQTAPTLTPTPEETVNLSPFQVTTTKDQGYRVTNSVSGTRLNAALKDVPMPIEVISAEFISDIGAKDLRQALSYSAGVVLQSQYDVGRDVTDVFDGPEGITGGKEQTQIKLRGFATTESLRRGLRRASYSDSIAIDRIEVVRGPAALLYGVGNFGGIVNYLTKEPLLTEQYQVNAVVGSWDYLRGEVDFTGPLGSKYSAAYRVLASADSKEDYTEFAKRRSYFVMPAFSFKPFKNTKVLVDMEYGEVNNEGIGFQTLRAGTQTFSAVSRSQLPFLPTPGKDPRTFRWSGPDTYRNEKDFNLSGEITQRLAQDLTLLIGAQQTRVDFDSRDVRARLDNSLSPVALRRPFTRPAVAIFPQATNAAIGYTWGLSDETVDTGQVRTELNWGFKIGSTKHNLLLGRSDFVRVRERDFSGTNSFPAQQYNWKALDDISYFRYDPATQVPLAKGLDEDLHTNNAGNYLVYQGKFFSDRLNIIGGLRYDRTDSKRIGYNLATGAVATVQTSQSGEPTTKWSPQIGVSYNVTRAVTLFALSSSGISPNDDKIDGAGNPSRPTTATSLEAGLKIDLFNGRISGTISAYRIERKDVPQYFWWAPAPRNDVFTYDATKPISYRPFFDGRNRLYTLDNAADYALLQQLFAGVYAPDSTAAQDYYIYGGGGPGNGPANGAYCPVDDKSEGMDAQIIFTITDNWQIVTGYSHMKRVLTRGPQLVKATIYSPFSVWYAQAESPVGKYGGGPVSNFSDPLDSSTYNRSFGTGLALDDSPHDTYTMWSHYKFTTGIIKNSSFGLGIRYEGPRDFLGGEQSITTDGTLLKPYLNQAERYEPSDSRLNVDLSLSHSLKFGRREVSMQLNVFNLLDNQQLYGDIYNTPRSMRFSIGTKF
jgi:iron complex outermembrane receptor protein